MSHESGNGGIHNPVTSNSDHLGLSLTVGCFTLPVDGKTGKDERWNMSAASTIPTAGADLTSVEQVFQEPVDLRPKPAAGTPIVFVLGDNASEQASLHSLVSGKGWQAELLTSPQHFLSRSSVLVPSCLVLDISPLGLNGLELQKRFAGELIRVPVIFVTNHAEVRVAVEAMKAGAVEFLIKPFRDEVLVRAIRQAHELSRLALAQQAEMMSLGARYSTLTSRERQVMSLVVAGLLNKQVGSELGISEITVKAHRGQVMHKMQANSLPDLVKMASRLTPSTRRGGANAGLAA